MSDFEARFKRAHGAHMAAQADLRLTQQALVAVTEAANHDTAKDLAQGALDEIAPAGACPELEVDPVRHEQFGDEHVTGVFVRAKVPGSGSWESADVAILTKPSVLAWLRSRGGHNRIAEDLVGILLGHGHLHGEGG